jgi:hypothetical protein
MERREGKAVEPDAVAAMTVAFEREQMERWQEREHDRAA